MSWVDKIAKNAIIVNIAESKNIEIKLTYSILSYNGVEIVKFVFTPSYCIIS